MNVGFIGLGSLGLPIAENILAKTNQLFVYNRTASRVKPLVDKGAVSFDSVREIAAACDIVFTVLSNDDAVKSITKGQDGIAANLPPGGIHISVSTILPETAVQLYQLHEQHDSSYVSAPVMGRPEVAQARKLNFLVSGDSTILERIHPLLINAGAARVSSFGGQPGAANVAKLCSNFLIASAI
jgi:3-hydroxyisobutyrate dehydrogenase-like beta-hydroxyacid dehydrogenase